MRNIGVDSLPLAAIVAAFIGAVTAFQTRYQLFGGVQLSVVGLISRQSIILELGPLLTGLVLTGRVGARMTAELGTMRVTEQKPARPAFVLILNPSSRTSIRGRTAPGSFTATRLSPQPALARGRRRLIHSMMRVPGGAGKPAGGRAVRPSGIS